MNTNPAGVYVHIPYCAARCGYCSFVSSCDRSTRHVYVRRLVGEINDFLGKGIVADTVYFGGGTPSVLEADLLKQIADAVKSVFILSPNTEFTVECNPDSATDEFFEFCVGSGVNRISMGLQDADDDILRRIGRLHAVDQFTAAVERARAHGINNIATDLILGLPGQTAKHVQKGLALVADLDIPHVSVYALKLEEGSAMYGTFTPDEDVSADLYEQAAAFLNTSGRKRYEVSNFSRLGFESRHNRKYWQHVPYYGFGVSAHSFYGGERVENTASIDDYLAGTTVNSRQKITADELREEIIMLRLRCADGLSLSEYRRLTGGSLLIEKENEVAHLRSAGMIDVDGDRLAVTDKGMYLLNSIILKLI